MNFPRFLLSSLVLFFCGSLIGSETISINGNWQCQIAESVNTPPTGEWVEWKNIKSMQLPNIRGLKRNQVHCVWQKTDIKIPAEWKESRYLLYSTNIGSDAIVFINGKRIGELLGPFGGIEFDSELKPEEVNEIRFFVTRNYTDVSRNEIQDYVRDAVRGPNARFGRPMAFEQRKIGVLNVSLTRLPNPAAVKDVWAKTSWRQKKIDIDVTLSAASEVKAAILEAKITDQDGKEVFTIQNKGLALKSGDQVVTLSEKWENPHCWELDGAYLYNAVVSLKDSSGKILDSQKIRFGFREIWREGKQIMINGHPARFRVEWTGFGLNENSVSFLKLLGRNMVYQQNNPGAWYQTWNEAPTLNEEDLNLCDKNGIGFFAPAPIANFMTYMYDKPGAAEQYRKLCSDFIRRYRNHPSILAWNFSMCGYCGADGIHPDTIGRTGASNKNHIQVKLFNKVYQDFKKIDPTRFAYTHGDGNIGDIGSGNTYPNFAPLQEVEDWGEKWAEGADLPWFACETAAIYNGSYFKGSMLLLTEYGAIYFGEDAYRRETEDTLKKTIDIGLKNKGGHGSNIPRDPLFFDLQKIYTEGQDRGWRSWGLQGWHYFNFQIGYGVPPNGKNGKVSEFFRYRIMTEPVTKRPDWANQMFDMHAKYMQSLMGIIGGYPERTSKDHSFYAGTKIVKSAITVWDGPGDLKLKAEWTLADHTGKSVQAGKFDIFLKNGDIKIMPIEFTAPNVDRRTEYTLKLKLSGWKETISDELAIQVFPAAQPVKTQRTAWLYDPAEKSGWIKNMIPSIQKYTNEKLGQNDLLIIGRESLKIGDKLPYTAGDLEKGLNVIILEQQPAVWETFGFRCIDTAPRYVFPAADPEKMMDGLKGADYINWNGSTTLLPSFKHARSYDVTMAPKTSNRGVVAPTVIEIPDVPSFKPLLLTEFDMSYSPLLRWNCGKGAVFFCSMEFGSRIADDPAAALAASNLIRTADSSIQVQPRAVITDLKGNPDPSCTILHNKGKADPKTADFLNAGGIVFNEALDPESLNARGIKFEEKTLRRILEPGEKLRKLATLNLLHWRDALTFHAIKNPGAESQGIYFERRIGKGKEVFLQVSDSMLKNRYKDDKKKAEAVAPTVIRLQQLGASCLTSLGAQPSNALKKAMTSLRSQGGYETLSSWYVFGPFINKTNNAVKNLAVEYPGEKEALAGDLNPNNLFKTDDGRALDFRKTARSNAGGFVDLGAAFNTTADKAMGYAIRLIESESDRTAMLRLGFDWYLKAYLNGNLIFDCSKGAGRAAAKNQFLVKVNLKKGTNVLVLKIQAGSAGFGFWADLSTPDATPFAEEGTRSVDAVYTSGISFQSPYFYHYW